VSDHIRWGVLGASSRIYHGKLRPPMVAGGRHLITAEASRDRDGSTRQYRDLLARPDVDAVYIPLPNDSHKPWILAALEAGKHVLCEKPLTLSPADTAEVFEAANSAGRVLMEAYMWPHHPRHQTLLAMAHEDLGALQSSYGTFTFPFDRPDDHRLDARGAGALFDVGIYCLGPMILLAPHEATDAAAVAARNGAGVDVSFSGTLTLGDATVARDGAQIAAHVAVSFDAPGRRSFDLIGSNGMISVGDWFVPGPPEPSEAAVTHRDGTSTVVRCPGANSFANMLDQFADVVNHASAPVWGRPQSELLARWIGALQDVARPGQHQPE
jgi:D-xylose 1-dehydrogenase (NADP+, D-xylono-1,5-lactone-forming)